MSIQFLDADELGALLSASTRFAGNPNPTARRLTALVLADLSALNAAAYNERYPVAAKSDPAVGYTADQLVEWTGEMEKAHDVHPGQGAAVARKLQLNLGAHTTPWTREILLALEHLASASY